MMKEGYVLDSRKDEVALEQFVEEYVLQQQWEEKEEYGQEEDGLFLDQLLVKLDPNQLVEELVLEPLEELSLEGKRDLKNRCKNKKRILRDGGL